MFGKIKFIFRIQIGNPIINLRYKLNIILFFDEEEKIIF